LCKALITCSRRGDLRRCYSSSKKAPTNRVPRPLLNTSVQKMGCIERIPHVTAPVPLANFDARIRQHIVEDDGVEQRHTFELSATDSTGLHSIFRVAASDFAAMNWPMENLGPRAIVFPNQKDHARTAIQAVSENVLTQRVHTHTGWVKREGTDAYLHSGGAITACGEDPLINVKLDGSLGNYVLGLPSPDELGASMGAVFEFLELAPPSITYPLLAAVHRAVLRSCDFSIHLSGPTGVFKSELAALVQQFFGPSMNARNLPGSWSGTENSLEA
jgi:hypothetical protein